MRRCARATRVADSQFCERYSRFRLGSLGAGLVLSLLVASAGPAIAAPVDDFRAGEQAYRRGDIVAAMASLRRAADAGHAPAQVMLAGILDQAEFDQEAMAYYRKAAEQGDPEGEFGVGAMYLAGEGVKQDAGQGYFWLTRAADKKHERAIVALAAAYIRAEKGEIPEGPDKARAAEWLRKAADLNDLEALEALARAHRAGGPFGLVQDAALADQYAAKAAAIRKQLIAGKDRKKKR